MFVLPRHVLADVRPVGAAHLRVELRSQSGGRLNAIAFRVVDTELGAFLWRNRGAQLHVAGHLQVNHWNGSRSAQLRIMDVAQASTV